MGHHGLQACGTDMGAELHHDRQVGPEGPIGPNIGDFRVWARGGLQGWAISWFLELGAGDKKRSAYDHLVTTYLPCVYFSVCMWYFNQKVQKKSPNPPRTPP